MPESGFSSFMSSPAGGAAVQGGFSIGGNLFSAREAKKANRRTVNLYRENRDWEEKMSNSEWQRGVADMVAAGINPMLAVQQGGASTPNTQAPTIQPVAKWSKVGESVSKNPAQLLAMQQAAANVKLTQANAYKTEKEGDITAFQAYPDVIGPEWDRKMDLLRAQIATEVQRGRLTAAQQQQIEEMLPITKMLETARRKLTEEQSTSAAQTRRLEGLTEPELQATKRWFEEMGASGRVMDFINKAITLWGRK